MKNPYGEHFLKKQKVARGEAPSSASEKSNPLKKATAEDVRALLRSKAKNQIKRKRPFPVSVIFSTAIFAFVAGWAWMNLERIEHFVSQVEISMMGSARAEGQQPSSPAPATPDRAPAEQNVAPEAKAESSGAVALGESEIEHLSRLRERKVELDQREEELKRAEAELELQKQELEGRLAELEKTRQQISEVLRERAEADDKKVDDLVQVYSTMKPVQAAKIFETMDEALAVKILGRMKKKPAAEILNLMKADKAKVIAEKYAGYKRLTD